MSILLFIIVFLLIATTAVSSSDTMFQCLNCGIQFSDPFKLSSHLNDQINHFDCYQENIRVGGFDRFEDSSSSSDNESEEEYNIRMNPNHITKTSVMNEWNVKGNNISLPNPDNHNFDPSHWEHKDLPTRAFMSTAEYGQKRKFHSLQSLTSQSLIGDDSTNASFSGGNEEDTDTNSMSMTSNALLDMTAEFANTGFMKETIDVTPSTIASIKLASILNNHGVPKSLFDQIVHWAKEYEGSNECHEYDTLMKNLNKHLCYDKFRPQQVVVTLPIDDTLEKVTVFDFKAQLFSLLTDTELFQPENLIFGCLPGSDRDIFDTETHFDFRGDIHQSQWYKDTCQKLVKDELDIVIPIIGFQDETHHDSKGRCTTDPFSFTLGCFKRHVRNDAQAWRHLGFVPKSRKRKPPNFPNNQLSELKVRDFHQSLDRILSSYKDFQSEGPHAYEFPFCPGTLYRVHFPFMYLIGDMKGHCIACGRKAPNLKSHCAMRDCDCPSKEVNNARVKCTRIKASSINLLKQEMQLMGIENKERVDDAKMKLHRLSHFPRVENAFDGIDFGSNQYGINGSTPSELLHLFKMKFPVTTFESLLEMLGTSGDTQYRLLFQKHICEFLKTASRQSDRSFPSISIFRSSIDKEKVYTADEKMNRIFAVYLFCLTDSASDIFLQRAKKNDNNQRDEISKTLNQFTKLMEMMWMMYDWLNQDKFPAHLCQPEDADSFQTLGNDIIIAFRDLYQQLVMNQKMKVTVGEDADEISCLDHESDSSIDEESSSEMLSDEDNMSAIDDGTSTLSDESNISTLSDESIENDHQTPASNEQDDAENHGPKLHALLHVLGQVWEFGSARNFDSGPLESGHKLNSKLPGKRSAKHKASFVADVAKNWSEMKMIRMACAKTGITKPRDFSHKIEENIHSIADEGLFDFDVDNQSSKFVVRVYKTINKLVILWEKEMKVKRSFDDAVCKNLLDNLCGRNGVLRFNQEAEYDDIEYIDIPGYTSIKAYYHEFTNGKTKDQTIRAHPCYYSGYVPWFDCAYIFWEGFDTFLPSRIEMIIDLQNLPRGCFIRPDRVEEMNTICVLTRSVDCTTTECIESDIQRKKKKEYGVDGSLLLPKYWKLEKRCRLVSVVSLRRPAFAFPNYSTKYDHELKKFVQSEIPNTMIEITPRYKWIDFFNEYNVSTRHKIPGFNNSSNE